MTALLTGTACDHGTIKTMSEYETGEGVDGDSGRMSANDADTTRALLELVTQDTRFKLIQNIVAHPEEAPSLKELDYANPSKSKSTIRNHLEKLVDAGVVVPVELEGDQRQRDLPYRFYQLSESGQELLEKHELLRAEETLKKMHSMLEKTPQIERYIKAPRPDGGDQGETDDSRRTLKP